MTRDAIQQGFDTILTTAKLMARSACQGSEVARHLGEVQGGGEPNVPLKVKPSSPFFKAVRVVQKSETGEPTQVILEPVDPLPMASLVAAFGDYDELPMLPNPHELPRVSFDLPFDQGDHSVTLLASYESDNDEADEGRVSRLVLFRDG